MNILKRVMKRNILDRILPRKSSTATGVFSKLKIKVYTHGFTLNQAKFILFQAVLLAVLVNIARLFSLGLFTVAAAMALLEGGIYYIYIKRRKRLTDLLEDELPQLLESIARVYRVRPVLTFALEEAITMVNSPVVRKEFEDQLALARFGATSQSMFHELAQRFNSRELEFMAQAVELNLSTGGDLSGQFDHMARVLRNRREAMQEVANLMFQNKVSSFFACMFVPVIILLVFITNPQAHIFILETSVGRLILSLCLLWWIAGLLMMRKLLKVTI